MIRNTPEFSPLKEEGKRILREPLLRIGSFRSEPGRVSSPPLLAMIRSGHTEYIRYAGRIQLIIGSAFPGLLLPGGFVKIQFFCP
jgi:hypothetical protein